MPICRHLMVAIMVALGLAYAAFSVCVAHAQNNRTSPSAVAPLLEQLRDSSNRTGVADARARLRDMVTNPSLGRSERLAIEDTIITSIQPALQDEALLVRLNAAIVVSSLSQPEAVPLLTRLLADDNEAIRLRGAKGIVEFIARRSKEGMTNAQVDNALIKAMGDHISPEQSNRVVQELFLGLVTLDTDQPNASVKDAVKKVMLDKLAQRPQWRLRNLAESLSGEYAALRHIYQATVRLGANAPAEDLKNLATVAMRYKHLMPAVFQVAEQDVAVNFHGDYNALHRVVEFSLDASYKLLAPNNPSPGNTPSSEPDMILQQINTWLGLFSRAPINLPREQMILK